MTRRLTKRSKDLKMKIVNAVMEENKIFMEWEMTLSFKKYPVSDYNLLISIPGIGFLTAMTFLVQIGDIRRFRQLDDLCDYIGLVPMMKGSGPKLYTGKMINRGRKELKIMIIEAAWDAVRMDPDYGKVQRADQKDE